MTDTVQPIDQLIDNGLLPTQADLPEDFDPLAEGILMSHQKEWLEDRSPLKIAEKCRRSGFTFAEALDNTITAATARGEGGSNVFYIGDTKDKGREFIGYCAHFARVVAGQMASIEEFLFDDLKEDGSTNQISAFRITFASGYRIVALSSRPENIRGLQGIVVIDEAAFHKDVGEVIDAAQALTIWGGKIRVISTHNGILNPFNDLVIRTVAGKTKWTHHRITFDEVIENGLYERYCLMVPDPQPFDEWYATIREGYTDESRMREELDAIPRDAEGSALARVQVEACTDRAVPVLRLAKQKSFIEAPEDARRREVDDWLREHVAPVILERIDINKRTAIGADIARKGHGTSIIVSQIGAGLKRECAFVIELRNLPFDQLRQVLWFIFDRAGRRWSASIDASGLGMETAEAARVKYGTRVTEVMLNNAWYRENGAKIVTSIEDQTMTLPADDDIVSDICALAWIGGLVKIPEGHETTGQDGGKRHADAAIAGMLMEHAAGIEPAKITEIATAGARAPEAEGYAAAEGDTMQPVKVGAGWANTVPSGIDFSGFGEG
ncbi:MAG: hypothetical protein AAF415_12935 [Pseudomonadota bacterium]